MVTLEALRDPAAGASYPCHLLRRGDSALVLFASGFHGRQDAFWIADAGLTATCVDLDAKRLGEMVLAYPEGWEYLSVDAFEYASVTFRQWDVVSIDCPTNLFGACAEALPVWCELARRVVVLGTGVGTRVVAPAGWQVTDVRQRSSFRGGVFWTVLEPA